MSQQWYEIFLSTDYIQPETWQSLFLKLAEYLGWRSQWRIYLEIRHSTARYYLLAPEGLPSSLELAEFLIKPLPDDPLNLSSISCHINTKINLKSDNLLLILHKLNIKTIELVYFECCFYSVTRKIISRTFLVTHRQSKFCRTRLLTLSPAQLFSVDYAQSRHLRYKRIPKYLDSEKVFRLARSPSSQELLLLDTFPYSHQPQGINLDDFDFARHSFVIGGSGSGKSRFLSLLISRLYRFQTKDYKVVIIDPHDTLKHDFGEVASQCTIDFRNSQRSVDLFQQTINNLNVSVELMLGTFKTLIGANYNGRLERVLRHAIYLLLLDQSFTFSSLRQLLSDSAYRNTLLTRLGTDLPSNISHFFLTEFQELRSSAYNLAFAPIIAFIDEMQMVPSMNQPNDLPQLGAIIANHFLTIFSLNRLFLGDKPTQVIAGLIMQQLFLLAGQCSFPQHLILVIDEAAIIENPILPRFLSEMRKYGVTVILAGQYFKQISSELRAAILANVTNYYIFRVSRDDADIFGHSLQYKMIGNHDSEDFQKILTGLKTRECLVRISRHGEPYSLFKAYTPHFDPPPNSFLPPLMDSDSGSKDPPATFNFTFSTKSRFSAQQLMQQNSTNRKPLKHIHSDLKFNNQESQQHEKS